MGEVPEDLSGSTKSVACVERNVENLGDPKVPGGCVLEKGSPQSKQVGGTETKSREARNDRESDQSIVLRDGRADHVQTKDVCKGKGLTEIRSL